MIIDFKVQLPEIEDLIDDLTDQPHSHHYHVDIHRECHGFVDCLGQFVDYLTSCFH